MQPAQTAQQSSSHFKTVLAVLLGLVLVVPAIVLNGFILEHLGFRLPGEDLSGSWLPWPLNVFLHYWLGSVALGVFNSGLSFYLAITLIPGAARRTTSYAIAVVFGVLTAGLAALAIYLVLHGVSVFDDVSSLLLYAGMTLGPLIAETTSR